LRRGQIQGADNRGDTQVVEATVPAAALVGFADKLHSLSQGRAQYTMQFSHYQEVQDGGGPPDTEPSAAALRA
jgi:elongation factor G